jgi:hypothetical protein
MENRVENAQVIVTDLDVVNHVYVVMYNGKLYMEFIVNTVNTFYLQGLQEKTCKAEQDCFRTQGQTETSLKIEDLKIKRIYDQKQNSNV